MKKALLLTLSLLLILGITTGCGAESTSTPSDIPFSDFGWESTQEEIEKANGISDKAYDGIYGGKALVYDKQYQGLPGEVVYMFSTDGKLADIAWRTTNESDDVLTDTLNSISDELSEKYGEKTFDNTNETAVGGKWESENIHILLNKVNTGDAFILQIAYLNQDTAKLGYIEN